MSVSAGHSFYLAGGGGLLLDSAGTLTMQYGYDKASSRTSMTDPQSVGTVYGYDTLNRLHTLTHNNQTPNFVFGYDALSRRNSLTRPTVWTPPMGTIQCRG